MGDYPNGHKEWLETQAEAGGSPVVQAVCHAALYLGRVLEQQAWAVGRIAAAQYGPPAWWEKLHPNPELMREDTDGG